MNIFYERSRAIRERDLIPGCLRSGLSLVLTCGFLLLRNFSVAISVSPHVCFILVLILISMFLR